MITTADEMRNDVETGFLSHLLYWDLASFFGDLCDAFDRFPQTGCQVARPLDCYGSADRRLQSDRAAFPEFLGHLLSRGLLYRDAPLHFSHTLVLPVSGLPRRFQYYHRTVRWLYWNG